MTWRLRSVRLFVYGLTALQLVQGLRTETGDFIKSYWFIDYDHGFVRRGLTGAALQAIGGQTERGAVVATWVLGGLAAVAIIVLLELLLQRGTPQTCALAILLAASPFTLDYVMQQRRPDLLALPVLIGLGLALRRDVGWARPACATAGLLFGILVFVHDGVVLQAVPFALLLVVILVHPATNGKTSRSLVPLLSLVAGPACVAAVVVNLFGSPGAATVAALRADASGIGLTGGTEFDYLGDSARTSVEFLWTLPRRVLFASLALGLVLAAAQIAWLRAWVGQHVIRDVVTTGQNVGKVVLAIVGTTTIALFAIGGADWLRWCAEIGCYALIVSSFALLDRARSPHDRTTTGRVRLPRLLPIAALYLAVLVPLSPFVSPGEAVHVLLRW